MATKIEWTDGGDTWNPIRARNKATGKVGHYCARVSPGCEHCYAERLQPRFGNPIRYAAQDQAKVDIFLDEKTLTQPLRWKRGRKIFPCSMTDLFGEWVTDETLDRIFAVMALTPQHTYMILTKRSARMREYITRTNEAWHGNSDLFADRFNAAMDWNHAWINDIDDMPWPLPHVWLYVSVEDQQRADERIPDLLATPAAIRGLSVEPQLGPIDLSHIDVDGDSEILPLQEISAEALSEAWGHPVESGQPRIDHVIVGGESGPGARPFDLAWARSLRDQCQAAGVPYFLKQVGAHCIETVNADVGPDGVWGPYDLRDRKGGKMEEWPEDLRVREFPGAARSAAA